MVSNAGMDPVHALAERLTELEIKASFQEDRLDKLDQIIIRQQQQIDTLARELAHQRQQAGDNSQGTQRNLRDDLPPHY